MKRHSAWAVAAAIILREENAMHYSVLTDRVIKSDLSGLSEEGGNTPEQTLGAALRAHYEIFEPDYLAGEGCYYIPDVASAKQNPKIKAAIEDLERK